MPEPEHEEVAGREGLKHVERDSYLVDVLLRDHS